MIGKFKTWPIRKKVSYTAQCRFWEKKGWIYKHGNKLVPFSRWCKLIGSKEIWAYEYEVYDRYIAYRFTKGSGPCATLEGTRGGIVIMMASRIRVSSNTLPQSVSKSPQSSTKITPRLR